MVFSCKQVDLTAPGGATISLSVQPGAIDKDGTATLTVVGTRASGAPLPDETVIRFIVEGNFGSVSPNPVETKDGIATATFSAGGRSGTAIITASSGEASDDVEIVVGEARVNRIILTASPSSLPFGGGEVTLKAFVFDEDGNALSRIDVVFETDSGTLSSGGAPVETDSSGLAEDTLAAESSAEVTASISGRDISDSLTISVTEGTPPTCGASVSPSGSVAIGQDLFFTDTSTDDGDIDESFWDFGDGSSRQGFDVTHSYDEVGSFVVVHRIVDDQGIESICSPLTVDVQQGTPPTCSLVRAPSGDVNVGDSITFTDTSTDSDGQIDSSTWAFGDGDSLSGQTVVHSYDTEGSFTVIHTVEDTQGLTSVCTADVNVNFVGSAPSCSFTKSTSTGSFVVSFDASASTDNDESGASIVTYDWDFGDGQTLSTSNPGTSHDYTTAGAGSYVVNLTVTDDEGDFTNCVSQTVTVPGP